MLDISTMITLIKKKYGETSGTSVILISLQKLLKNNEIIFTSKAHHNRTDVRQLI